MFAQLYESSLTHMNIAKNSLVRQILLAGLCLISVSAAEAAGNAVNGKVLYNSTNGSPVSCASAACHGTNPSTGMNKIQRGINGAVTMSAITQNKGGMGFLSTYVNSTQADDIGAYIANPSAANVATQTVGTISFSPATFSVGGTTTASATATSGLAVSFSSKTPSVCTVSGSAVTAVATGTCTIAADQAGNASYSAAAQVTQNISIAIDTVASPLTGLWWNQNESGWGMSLTQHGAMIFVAWYTYDATAQPMWYVMSACPVSGSSCTGDIYSVSGGTQLGVTWNGSGKVVTKVGSGTITFTDNDTGSFNFTLNGVTGSKSITRQVFATGSTAPAINYSSLWWNANESGWGVALTHQYGIIFATMYTYDASGNPIWYVASNCAIVANGCAGDLYKVTNGSIPTVTWNGGSLAVTKVGTVSFLFTDSSTGTMDYTINGVSGSKAIAVQPF